MNSGFRVANASLSASLQILLALAKKGLITEADVDEVANSISAALENETDRTQSGPDELSANYDRLLAPVLAQIRDVARQTRP